MKITALIENKSNNENLFYQYGVSFFLQTEEGNAIIDAGQDEKALLNFYKLGFKTEDIDAIFISHNHFDHIGGLQSFADVTSEAELPIYISSGAGKDLYSKKFLKKRVLVSRNDLIEYNADRIIKVDSQREIFSNVYACRVVDADTFYVCRDKKLRMLDKDGKLKPDDFFHEIYLAVIEDNSVKIISSCSHMGIVNIVRDAVSRFNLPVSVFVGGLHMRGNRSTSLNASQKYFNIIINELNLLNIKNIYTCHCTGEKGYNILLSGFKNEIKYFHTGDSFIL